MGRGYLPDGDYLDGLPVATVEAPLRVLFSSCLAGTLCGFDGTDYGVYPEVRQLMGYENVRAVLFCPEHYSFGTPRELCDIHGGDGFDVLDGKARVLTEGGDDWTEGMIKAAEQMLALALKQRVHFAIMMDISAACGSAVVYAGARRVEQPVYQMGVGVCAALLIRNGIRVMSQRDYYTLGLVMQKVDPGYVINPNARDHHQGEWYRDYFKIQE